MTPDSTTILLFLSAFSPVWGALVLFGIFRIRAFWKSLTYKGHHERN